MKTSVLMKSKDSRKWKRNTGMEQNNPRFIDKVSLGSSMLRYEIELENWNNIWEEYSYEFSCSV